MSSRRERRANQTAATATSSGSDAGYTKKTKKESGGNGSNGSNGSGKGGNKKHNSKAPTSNKGGNHKSASQKGNNSGQYTSGITSSPSSSSYDNNSGMDASVNELRFECSTCPRTFVSISSLQQHLKQGHKLGGTKLKQSMAAATQRFRHTWNASSLPLAAATTTTTITASAVISTASSPMHDDTATTTTISYVNNRKRSFDQTLPISKTSSTSPSGAVGRYIRTSKRGRGNSRGGSVRATAYARGTNYRLPYGDASLANAPPPWWLHTG
jgi:hypothetical protein